MKSYKIIIGLTVLALGCPLLPLRAGGIQGGPALVGGCSSFGISGVGVSPTGAKVTLNNNGWNNGWNRNNGCLQPGIFPSGIPGVGISPTGAKVRFTDIGWNNGWNCNNRWNGDRADNNRRNGDRDDNNRRNDRRNCRDRFANDGIGFAYYGPTYGDYPPWYRMNYSTNSPADYDPSSDYRVPGAMSQAPVNADIVVAVQRELRNRGFYRGVVNGLSDAPTRAAVRSFETSMGLPITGIIGLPLLKALGYF